MQYAGTARWHTTLFFCYIFRNPKFGLKCVVKNIYLKSCYWEEELCKHNQVRFYFKLFYYCFLFSAKNLLPAKPLVGEKIPWQQQFPIRGQKTYFLPSQHFFSTLNPDTLSLVQRMIIINQTLHQHSCLQGWLLYVRGLFIFPSNIFRTWDSDAEQARVMRSVHLCMWLMYAVLCEIM